MLENLKELREAAGLSQAQASRALGVSRQVWYNYERGLRQPDYETLLKMAELLGVPVLEVLGLCAGEEADKLRRETAVQKILQMSDDQLSALLAYLESMK